MKRYRVFIFIFICAFLLAVISGCAPEVPAGMELLEYSKRDFCEDVVDMALRGKRKLTICYACDKGEAQALSEDVLDAADELMEDEYVCARYLQGIECEFEQQRGCLIVDVSAKYGEDYDLLEALLQNNPTLSPQEYGEEQINAWLTDMAKQSDRRRINLYECAPEIEISDIDDLLTRLLNGDNLFGYAVENAEWTVTDYDGIFEIDMRFSYFTDVVPYRELTEINSEFEAASFIVDNWQRGTEKACMLLTEADWNYDEMFIICAAAEANAGQTACECEYFNCNFYSVGEGERICAVWVDYPMQQQELEQKNAELGEALDRLELSLKARGLTDETQLYLAIHDLVNDIAEYDDEIAKATEEDWLTTSMHAGRSAYGALVTGSTVCTGYARAFKALCDRMGLPCWVIYGKQEDIGHAWNAVLAEGKLWYVDCTFNDTGLVDDYFLMDEQTLAAEDYIIDEGYTLPDWGA